eukprot:CAMPEP_0172602504 /NCGR_PEP_ID=MMETSP1068-20121228/22679_1 /TAXON_ID=35684 /ORGANISM="Pseudopedinella elastica, Strain CCMP716" /LENGTH=609 /DNA_ID=CAMNT_0013403877 /DNA_START=75 /DNA_END=1904 /DNA_ORIENTATION=-
MRPALSALCASVLIFSAAAKLSKGSKDHAKGGEKHKAKGLLRSVKDAPSLPWCRKGTVMVALPQEYVNLGPAPAQEHRKKGGDKSVPAPPAPAPTAPINCGKGCDLAPAPVPALVSTDEPASRAATPSVLLEQPVLVWSGKGHDKALRAHGSSMLGDTWLGSVKMDLAKPRQPKGGFGVEWGKVDEERDSAPTPRWKSDGDFMGGYFWVFGGDDLTPNTFLDDVWVLPVEKAMNATSTWAHDKQEGAAVGWTKLKYASDSPRPHPRRGIQVVALEDAQGLLVVGGRQKRESCLGDSWLLKLPEGWDAPGGADDPAEWAPARWQRVPSLPSECRWGHASVKMRHRGAELAVVFGGRNLHPATNKWDYQNELWFFDALAEGGGAWTQAINMAVDAPQPRDHTSITFDAGSASLYVFGGRVAPTLGTPALNDLWKYSLETLEWTELKPAGMLPESRYMHVAAGLNGAMAVFGGEHIDKKQNRKQMNKKASKGGKKNDEKFNDLWAYSIEDNHWTLLSKSHCKSEEESANVAFLALMFAFIFVGAIIAPALAATLHLGWPVQVYSKVRDYFWSSQRNFAAHGRGQGKLSVELQPFTSCVLAQATRKMGYEQLN